LFERGVRLSRECQDRLQQAERRIEVLLQRDGGEARTGVFDALDGEEFAAPASAAKDADDDESVF
jgi:diphthamide synthase (EF-2-diphthine--ammonia ligase)